MRLDLEKRNKTTIFGWRVQNAWPAIQSGHRVEYGAQHCLHTRRMNNRNCKAKIYYFAGNPTYLLNSGQWFLYHGQNC